jgi:YVTN family beta-propeller protein
VTRLTAQIKSLTGRLRRDRRNRGELTGLFRTLTAQAVFLTAGGRAPTAPPCSPQPDDGVMGPAIPADALTVTVGVGASLFDGRYGLAARKPVQLVTMTPFRHDDLDPALSDGDLLIQLCAGSHDTAAHAQLDIIFHTNLYVADGGSNSVSVLDTRTNRVTATIHVGTSPVSVAVTRDGTTAYVANEGSASLSVISTRTDRVVRALPAGQYPVAVAVAPGGDSAYVANEVNARVSVVSVRTGTITATVPTGQGPFGVTLAPSGQSAYAAILGPGDVSAISTQTHRIWGTVNVGPPQTDPFNVAVTSGAVYVTDQGAGTVTVIDPKALKVAATITVGDSPYGVAVDP